jgi:hypothetical protein
MSTNNGIDMERDDLLASRRLRNTPRANRQLVILPSENASIPAASRLSMMLNVAVSPKSCKAPIDLEVGYLEPDEAFRLPRGVPTAPYRDKLQAALKSTTQLKRHWF